MTIVLEQPVDRDDLALSLRRSGYAWLSHEAAGRVNGPAGPDWHRLRQRWSALPRDPYLKDGGRYRARRHGSMVYDAAGGVLRLAPHRAHWQPVEYNALHGGMSRWFEPLEAAFVDDPGLRRCIAAFAEVAIGVRPADRLFIEVHQVRIDTGDGIGRPTPEGAHRDGVDFVAVWMVGCEDVRGGETRIFEAHGHNGVRFTMKAPGSVVVLDDTRVVHETTPILPAGRAGVRDTLVVTYRTGGFLEPT